MKQNKAQCFICSPYDKETHSKIENEILSHEFTQESTWGFRVINRRSKYLQAVYIEKIVYLEKVTDPFGDVTQFERISYQQIDFQLSTFPPHILIFQPPRNFRKLNNQLAQFADYEIAIQTKEVKVFEWVDYLLKNEIKGVVTKINVDSIDFDNSTTGKLTLLGQNDIRERVYSLLSGTKFCIRTANIIFSKESNLPEVEIFANGKINFKSQVPVEAFKYFYDAFIEIASPLQTA